MNRAVPGLGPLESAIMTAVWDAGQPLTVRAARERLNYHVRSGEGPAYTTVLTVMTILWRKGLLSRARDMRERDARALWYEACISREDHLAAVIREALHCAPDPLAVLRRALAPASMHDRPAQPSPEAQQQQQPARQQRQPPILRRQSGAIDDEQHPPAPHGA